MKKQIRRLSLILIALSFSTPLFAKDLTNRLGVGYANPFSFDLPSVALHYHPSSKTSLAGIIGIDTADDFSKFGLMFKFFRTIFEEQNMNFLMGGSAAAISVENAGKSESGFEINALIAAEFFFTGLDSLAFRFETGVGIVSLDGVSFRTIGSSPLHAGIIFYF